MAVWQQVLRGERLGVGSVSVERQQQRCTFLHHSYPRVAPAAYPPLVPLGQPEPPLQLQVVPRRVRPTLAPDRHDRPRLPTSHYLCQPAVEFSSPPRCLPRQAPPTPPALPPAPPPAGPARRPPPRLPPPVGALAPVGPQPPPVLY